MQVIRKIDLIIVSLLIILAMIFRGSFGFVLTALLYLIYLLYRYLNVITKKRLKDRWIFRLYTLLLTLGAILFCVVEGVLISTMIKNHASEPNVDYVIVLGAGLRGENPSPTLKLRLDRAVHYYQNHPHAYFIVSGGIGHNLTISEAEVMGEYLRQSGIPTEQIMEENHSRSTEENLRFSVALLKDKVGKYLNPSPIGVISNDFHLYRVGVIASHIEVDIVPIAAPSIWYLLPRYLTREFFALMNEYRKEWFSYLSTLY